MLDLHSILSRGYFPRELPPVFSTVSFSTTVTNNVQTLPTSFTSARRISKLSRQSIARVGLHRRTISVPNPVGYFNLANALVQNWNALESHFSQSTTSKSKPSLRSIDGRAVIPSHDYVDLIPHKAFVRAKSKYVLTADISRFYPSIYTHSIPWALHTKPTAKANKSDYSYLGNNLDRWIRNSQDGQTMGIPIGPDASLIVSEIILTAIDQLLTTQLNRGIRYYRFVDDYEFGCTSFSEAEQVLARLQVALNEYELEVNSIKTKIIELPAPLDSAWVYELRNFQFREPPYQQRKDLITYFDRAFLLAEKNPDDHVLQYAIQRLQSVQIDQTNWELAEQLHIQCIMNETGTFLPVLGRLIDRHKDGFSIDLVTMEEVINTLICLQSPIDHGSEVSWALWAAIYLELSIGKDAAEALSKMKDSFVALLALDAHARKLIPLGLDTSLWESYMNEDELYGEHWLLSYEANIKGWLTSNGNVDHVAAEPNFCFLKNNNVKFYDPLKAKSIPTGASISQGLYPLFLLPDELEKDFRNFLIKKIKSTPSS